MAIFYAHQLEECQICAKSQIESTFKLYGLACFDLTAKFTLSWFVTLLKCYCAHSDHHDTGHTPAPPCPEPSLGTHRTHLYMCPVLYTCDLSKSTKAIATNWYQAIISKISKTSKSSYVIDADIL